MAKVANLKSNIQSTIQQSINERQKQIASSSAAAKGGSTETPTVTEAPKVTPTAKAVPSVTRPEITPASTATISTTPTVNARDLLGTKTTPTLRQASQDLLSPATEKEDIQKTTIPLNIVRTAINMGGKIANTVAESLYDQGLDWINEKMGKLEETRKDVTEKVGSTAIDLFKGVGQDISTQWSSGEGIGMVRDFIANTAEGLPRGITRIEYGLAEMLDRASDAKWVNDLKSNIESNLDYWENTRVYKKVSETSSFKDFLKNPGMYAGGTFTEMLPMFINAWVAVPTTYAQMYGDAYRDYAQDESLSDLTDNQIRLMATGVAGVNTIIELGADLIQGIMPWTKTAAKAGEREVRRVLSKPFSNLIKKLAKGGISEGLEEVAQNEIQEQIAAAAGSDRELPTWGSRLTTFGIAAGIGSILQGGNIAIDIKKHKELQAAFNEWSEAVDKIAPGVSQKDKEALFSAIVAAEIEDANMSEDLVNKYETQTTELYNRIDELNAELETTTNENRKLEINRQIEDANQRIKNIDEIINKGNAIMEEVNQKLKELSQKEAEELITPEEEVQLPREEGGENLSEQTMREVEEEKIPQTEDEYKSFANALRQPQNNILKTLSNSSLIKIDTRAMEMRPTSSPEFAKELSFIRDVIQKELESRYKEEAKSENEDNTVGIKPQKKKFKNAQEYIDRRVDYAKRTGEWKEKYDKTLRAGYMGDFIRNNLEGDLAMHLPGLKGVSLKQIEGDITEDRVREIAEMIALVSKTFGIDFNKIINDAHVSLNVVNDPSSFLYNEGNYGVMERKPTVQQIKDLIAQRGSDEIIWRRGNKRYIKKISPSTGSEILKMGVAVLLKRGPGEAAATMAHELFHLIDFALSTREGLPLHVNKEHLIEYTSIIKGDRDWKTFKEGKGYTQKRIDYYNDWSEILARYAQQYFAYINNEDVFNDFAGTEEKPGKDWYWSKEEFEKLLPKFEQLINSRMGQNMLDKGNEFYYEVVKKINDNRIKKLTLEFDKELNENDINNILDQIEEEYAWIMQTVEGMQGDLKEEMEAFVQLSSLQSNYEMAKAKGQEYIDKLKTTPQQQETIDNVTTEVVPDPPQNPETIKLGLPYYGGSNIENGINDLSEGGEGTQLDSSYMNEQTIVNTRKRKNKWRGIKKELWEGIKDLFTPAISRLYNISPRIAGRLITMETQKDVNIYRYREQAKGFVETLGGLKGAQALEVKKALLDYGAQASEQTEDTIADYKKQEVAKLKEVLLRNGFKEKDINAMFKVLDDIGQQYRDAGLSVTLTDMYFPRVVKDYEGLIDYMNRVSGKDIKVNKTSLMIRIRQIQEDTSMTDEEKESRIRNLISREFRQPGTTSLHGKERKLGLLSEWGEGIYAYYENPIEALDHYIATMTNAIQRQLFLGGMLTDANITENEILNMDTAESVSTIIGKLVENGQISEDDVAEVQKTIMAVLNKKRSPKSVTAIKDVTYIATITNFLSAINQLDDLGMVILKDKSGLKHIVKTIFGKANIKYDDLGLEDAYEMFREEGGVTNWLFRKSLFNTFDRLGKTSFINTAWESMVRQAKNEKTRKYLYTRLQSMYGTESADRMMEKIDSGNYNGDDGQIDIEILRDLLYQLGSTQPLYTSAMPTTYLNHPRARLAYALSSFTLKRIDWLVQGTKEVYQQHGAVAAGAWVMGVSSFLAMFGAAIGDVGDLLKGDKEETFLWKWINEGIDEALKSAWGDALDSWLKIWDLSEYDIKTYKQQGLRGVFASKIKPFIFDLGKDVQQAIAKRDMDEITDLAKYVPIFGKLVYYWLWDDLGKSTKGELNLDNLDIDFDLDLDDIELDLDDIELDLSGFELNI